MVELQERITLGPGGVAMAPLGVGTWAWGERRLWNYGRDYGQADLAEAFAASVGGGVTLFDTAEIHGKGESERLLGEFVRASATPIVVATKIAPYPWRLTARAVRRALAASLRRLGLPRVAAQSSCPK